MSDQFQAYIGMGMIFAAVYVVSWFVEVAA